MKDRKLFLVIVGVLLILIAIMVFVGPGKAPLTREKPDPNIAYRIIVKNKPNAPLLDDEYYCAFYKLDDRHLTMYDADSNIVRDIVLRMDAECIALKNVTNLQVWK